jgi:hypothetical protein
MTKVGHSQKYSSHWALREKNVGRIHYLSFEEMHKVEQEIKDGLGFEVYSGKKMTIYNIQGGNVIFNHNHIYRNDWGMLLKGDSREAVKNLQTILNLK